MQLEGRLRLLEPPLTAGRFLQILQRFWGFHQVWEPLLETDRLAALRAGRSRLAVLAADLGRLGMTSGEIAALPLCPGASGLAGSAGRVLGSLYVMEGSTLGGQMISRALSHEPWAAGLGAAGLGYFNPYGPRTGVMWREFRAALDAFSGEDGDVEIIGGALDTFALLQDWLVQ